MKILLTLLDGEKIAHKIEKDSIVIGRSNKCDLVITHEAMSRAHCRLDFKDGEIFITDLGSINGVFINGEKIPANSTIPFQTYLHLAFGAVISAQVEIDEVTKVGFSTKAEALNYSGPSSIEVVKKPKKNTVIKNVAQNKKTQKTSSQKPLNSLAINIMVFLVIMLGLYFGFYHGNESATTAPLEESIPSQPKVIENKDHF